MSNFPDHPGLPNLPGLRAQRFAEVVFSLSELGPSALWTLWLLFSGLLQQVDGAL